jgi:TonB-linked SusC/RagA family outer membrane protein
MKQVNIQIPLRLLGLILGIFLSVGAFAQITVKGHVKDAQGEPIIGATIRVAGQPTGGTISDFDGNFTLKTNQGATLTVTYVGFQPVKATAAPEVTITLQDDQTVLSDIVVIGYGVARKTDLTGSVTAMKPDEKNHGMVTTAQDMIQGKIAGVNVNTTTGEPGGEAQIRIRGGASLNATNNPLIVIDGMPMDNNKTKGMNNPLSLVNPNDIESFTILKDASATAIYGSRGSNGVVIITTKKGRRNQKPQVSYNGTLSVSTTAKRLDMMNAADYRKFIGEFYGTESEAYKGLGDADTDWQDEIYHTGVSYDHNISVSGGAGNDQWAMPYRVSAGYTDQEGVLKKSGFRRITAGFTVNPSLLNDHLNMNINAKYAYSKTNPGGQDAIGTATRMDPTRPVRSNDKMFDNWHGYWQWANLTDAYDPTFPYVHNADAPSNPVEQIVNYNFDKDSHVLLGNFEADYKIHGLEDIHLHMNLAGEYATGGEYDNKSPYSSYGYYYGGTSENTEKKYNVIATAYAQYYKDFNKNNHFDIMGGYEYSRTKYWGGSTEVSYYPSTYLGTDDNGRPKAGTINSETIKDWKGQTVLVSWYGRANYTLMDRYLFTATARYDGSSRFADGHRWGFFPSAAFAWRVKDESFLKNVDAVSDLKLRLGWGKTGQQDTGKEYYTPTYKVNETTDHVYPIGPGNKGILYQPKAYNNDLTWETTTTWNIGLDYGMFNQRLTLNVDAYKRNTTDLLCQPTISAGQNYDNTILLNAGELENKGIEVAVTGKPIQSKDWFLEVGVNASYNKNKIKELYGGRDMIESDMKVGMQQYVTYHKVGEAANAFWVYQQVYDETGRPIQGVYVDRNGDGSLDDNDRYFYKNITAPWAGGFYLKVSYKEWDLGTNFRASIGNYVFNDLVQGKMNVAMSYNPKGFYENTTPEIAALKWKSYNYPLSDYFVQNASFLKCDNITLGYNFTTFDTYLTGRVYASCSNVFTITKYTGLDPEQTTGKESSVYPRSRTFLVGLNLNF